MEIKCLLKKSLVSSGNKPTSVGIDPISSFEAIKIIWEKIGRKNKLAIKKRIYFISKHTSKTENSRLHNPRLVSSVNKPTSVGIEPVTLFKAITIIWEKIRENKLEAKNK